MNQLIFLRQAMYSLKREYGVSISLYQTVTGNTDFEAGTKSLTRTRYYIHRAVVTPIKYETSAFYNAAFLKAARGFAYGGYQDLEIKRVIIDARDLPIGLVIEPEDYLVISHQKFEIKYLEKLEGNGGWQMIVQRLKGAPVEETHVAVLYENVRFTQQWEVSWV